MMGLMGELIAAPWPIFIKITLEEEICVFMAELQEGNYLLGRHVGPLG